MPKNAGAAAIKSAFRRLAKLHRTPTRTTKSRIEIRRAKRGLRDPWQDSKRKAFDGEIDAEGKPRFRASRGRRSSSGGFNQGFGQDGGLKVSPMDPKDFSAAQVPAAARRTSFAAASTIFRRCSAAWRRCRTGPSCRDSNRKISPGRRKRAASPGAVTITQRSGQGNNAARTSSQRQRDRSENSRRPCRWSNHPAKGRAAEPRRERRRCFDHGVDRAASRSSRDGANLRVELPDHAL